MPGTVATDTAGESSPDISLSDRVSKVPSWHAGHDRRYEVGLLGEAMESLRSNRHESQTQSDPTSMA